MYGFMGIVTEQVQGMRLFHELRGRIQVSTKNHTQQGQIVISINTKQEIMQLQILPLMRQWLHLLLLRKYLLTKGTDSF